MLAFKREAVALVVLAFYFLVLDQQTQESRLQQLLLLQHLKRSRRKRLILLQIALRKTRRVRRAWSWLRNQFWFETLLNGNFVEEWWKENCVVLVVLHRKMATTWNMHLPWRNNARINNHHKKEIFICTN